MYRQYEDAYTLERKLDSAEIAMQDAISRSDEEMIMEIAGEIQDLEMLLDAACGKWQEG